MAIISSPANPRIKALRHLLTGRGREKSGLFLLEGPHLLTTLLDANVMPREVFYQPELLARTEDGRTVLARLRWALEPQYLVEVSERVMETIGETQTSQGVVCVLALETLRPERVRARRESRARCGLLILDGLADPGNMGTILRTALAADVEAVLLTPDCVDYFSPKVVRSAAGAHLALPVERDLSWEAIGERVNSHCGGRVLLTEASATVPYYAEDLTRPFALIIGNEAHGVSQAGRALASSAISIPLYNAVESLNAAMASGIILYEALRQRLR